MTEFLWLTLVLIMIMGWRGEKKEMTYWELILPMTATGLILVCPFLSKAVYFCSSLPLPIFLFLLHIPLFIQSLHSLCPFLIHLSMLSLPAFWFLTPVLWPLLSHMQVPPHSDFHWLCQTPSTPVLPPLESPDLGLSSCSAPGFFSSLSLLYFKGMVHTEFYQHWWHKVSSTE